MEIFRDIDTLRDFLKQIKEGSQTIGFVPTMGFLHEGHVSLIRASKEINDKTVVSIFVNPLQFRPNEDYERYPRDEKRDLSILEKECVDIAFLPSKEVMYRNSHLTNVSVKELTNALCGLKRPRHFDGVCTVIAKFFNIIKPNNAYFGLKDYQQYIIIRKMALDLNFDSNIMGMPIIRDEDGLAISSRNTYLSEEERQSALSLNKSFSIVERFLKNQSFNAMDIKKAIISFIATHRFTKIDYVEIVDLETLKELEYIDRSFLCALAVFVGNTRLIDNKIFELKNYQREM